MTDVLSFPTNNTTVGPDVGFAPCGLGYKSQLELDAEEKRSKMSLW